MTNTPESHTEPLAVDLELIQKVLPFTESRCCRVGEKLADTGARADCFYYVEQGRFEVSYMAKQTPIVVAIIGEGNLIGEIGFFDYQVRTRTVQAVCDAVLRVFDRAAMARLQSEQPLLYGQFLEYVLKSVCGRFRQILADHGPLSAYAASLSTGKERFKGLQRIPPDLLGSAMLQNISHLIEKFKAEMFDVAYRLQKEPGSEIPPELLDKGQGVLDDLKLKMREYGPGIDQNDAADLIWGYVFKEVFPYLMRSRFAEMAYYKPKGYAGDFQMIDLIYQNRPWGEGKLGYLVDYWALNQIPARAVRSRRHLLCERLSKHCTEKLERKPTLRIMNLACGPARELCDLLALSDDRSKIGLDSRKLEVVCVDIDPEALEFADATLRKIDHHARIRFMTENVIKWAIGRTHHEFQPQDIIYSSGLTDYLDDRLVKALINRCYKQLHPGGVLIIGNFSTANPDRFFMDNLLYWRLIHRDRDDLKRLFGQSFFGASVEIIAEEEGVNLFAEARRRTGD